MVVQFDSECSRVDFFSGDKGFSLVELLVVLAIMGIVSGLGITGLSVYKDSAEYSKAESTLRTARTALSISELDLASGFSLGLTYSGTSGEPLEAALSNVLPGASVPREVRIGVLYNSCEGADGADIKSIVYSQPCRSKRQTYVTKDCAGNEIVLSNVAFLGC